jgi:serine/threonine-protein kinase
VTERFAREGYMNLKGQTLGDYHLENVIGRGPRATVYRARHIAENRIVAVKVYDDSADPDAIRRAFESTQALTGAHVLPVEGFGVHHGLAYVAMRYMPKGSLKARWRRAVPIGDIGRLLPQIASALDHAHGLGVWHLNLKPGNILLDRPGNAFAADFGVPPLSKSPYTTPEIVRGSAGDARADVYALGAVLYEMLTGSAPIARRPRDESSNQRMADLPSPRSIRPGILPAVEAVTMRALSIDPESRYATPGALAQAFAEALEEAGGEQLSQASSRRRLSLGWIAGFVVLLLLVAVVALSGGLNAPASAPSPPPTATATEAAALTPSPIPTLTKTYTPTAQRATATVTSRPRTPSLTPTLEPTVSATSTLALGTVLTQTPTFRVVSLALKPPANRQSAPDRLDLFFDAVIEPAAGGPFGQLFGYLPQIDSLVTWRIGAQVSSGTQLLHVTLVVDCLQLPEPFTTNQVFLEIGETDRSPALYSQTIDYTKTWCR